MARSLLVVLTFAVAASASACTHGDDITAPATVAEQIPGTWSESRTIPGVSTIISLAVADTSITGTGTYTIEAGHPGTIVVTGTISDGKTVDLDLVRSDGWVGHFRGSLASHDSLSGSSWFRSSSVVGDPAPDSYHRIAP